MGSMSSSSRKNRSGASVLWVAKLIVRWAIATVVATTRKKRRKRERRER